VCITTTGDVAAAVAGSRDPISASVLGDRMSTAPRRAAVNITQGLLTVMSPDPVETVIVRRLAESTRTPTSRLPDPVSAWRL
jgi:hypothetical protein